MFGSTDSVIVVSLYPSSNIAIIFWHNLHLRTSRRIAAILRPVPMKSLWMLVMRLRQAILAMLVMRLCQRVLAMLVMRLCQRVLAMLVMRLCQRVLPMLVMRPRWNWRILVCS